MKQTPILPNEDDLRSDGTRPENRTRRIGAILIEADRLDEAAVQQIQSHATKTGLRFGDAAIQLKLLTLDDVEFALARQHNHTLLTNGAGGPVADEVVAGF